MSRNLYKHKPHYTKDGNDHNNIFSRIHTPGRIFIISLLILPEKVRSFEKL